MNDAVAMMNLDYSTGDAYKYTTAFYVEGASSITSTSNDISYCAFNQLGGVFQLYSTKLIDSSSTYTYN